MKKLLAFLLVFCCVCPAFSQVKIGNNPQTVSPGSLLELESTSKALTLPRMTTVQMQAIPSPISGMIIFNTDSNCIYLYKSNNVWASVALSAEGASNWPYKTNDGTTGAAGITKGIVSSTGNGLLATGSYSHAEGQGSTATGIYSWSSGYADTSTGTASIAMGYQNKASGFYSTSFGLKNIAAFQSSVAMGQENTDTGWASLAMGYRNKIFNNVSYSNVLGYQNQMLGGSSNFLSGESNIIRLGKGNMGLGYANIINGGNFGNAFGSGNDIESGNSNVAAGENNTVISGNANSIFGQTNIASGSYLGAIGKDNSVFFQSAVALGQGNMDSGFASIAGGLNNIINKDVLNSTSFGANNRSGRNLSLMNTVPGSGTFTAGVFNRNNGFASVAIGGENLATSVFGLAANHGTISNSNSMSSFGHFNDTIPAFQGEGFDPNEALFSIGNGTNNSNRRNSFTMLRNGFTTINATPQPGANVPRAELDIKGTGAIIVPVGTRDQRPAVPVVGMVRFCTDCVGGPTLQGYDGTNWVDL